MKAWIYLILFALVLGLPFAMRLALTRGQQSGRIVADEYLVVVTPHNTDIRREFERAFHEWCLQKHISVGIDYRTPGGTNDVRRLLENTYAGYRDKSGQIAPDIPADIDVVWGGGDYFFDVELKPLGVLQPIHLDESILRAAFPEGQETLAGVKLLDLTHTNGKLTPRWIGVALSAFGIVYNSDLYNTLGLPPPKTWSDLTDPKLNGLIELADPWHSASAATAYMMVLQRNMADAELDWIASRLSCGLPRWIRPQQFANAAQLLQPVPKQLTQNASYKAAIAAGWRKGMGQMLLIVANSRHFTDSSSQVPHDVGNGQAAVGVAIDFYGRVFQESVGPQRCRVVQPHAATAITPDPVGILYGVKGRKLELAQLFVEFLISREGQRLWELEPGQPGGPVDRAMRRPPIRRDVYADTRGWSDPDLNPFAEAGNFNQRSDWMGLMSDIRMIWAAAWIDNRDALRSAYERALSVRDSARRDALIGELSMLPVTMSEVEKIAAQRKELEKTGGADEWKARQRIEWDKKFREHYAKIAQSAMQAR